MTPNSIYKEAQRLYSIGNFENALRLFQSIPRHSPDHTNSLTFIAHILLRFRRYTEAEDCLKNLISIQPFNLNTLLMLGKLYRISGDHLQAGLIYSKAVEIDHNNLEALHGLGYSLYMQAEFQQAKNLFEKVLALNPEHIGANFLAGSVCSDMGEPDKAIGYFEKTLQLKPGYLNAHYSLIKARLDTCNWSKREEDQTTLIQAIENQIKESNPSTLIPMYCLNYFDIPLSLHKEAAMYNSQYIKNKIVPVKNKHLFSYHKKTNNKIRIGYISPDFRQHAVGILIYDLFKNHTREHFEIYAYSLFNAGEDDFFRNRIVEGCDFFREIQNISYEAAAQQINNDRIDILVDLGGHSKFTSPEIMALQPAPVQVQYLGYSDTMGADFIQYIIADDMIITPEAENMYTEKVIYIPHNFCASPLPISEKSFNRKELGLPQEAMVFCCMNSVYKIDPGTFKIWMSILKRVNDAVLWLSATNESVIKNIKEKTAMAGIDPERIIFMDKIPFPEYLKRMRLADLFLDTFIYNAGSTAICSARANLPLLTLPGKTNASRMGASVCRSMGLDELICKDENEYENKAVYLAGNQNKLKEIKEKMSDNIKTSSAFHLHLFVTYLEEAYKKIWVNYQEGNAPASLKILE